MNISFIPLTEAHLPLLLKWLQTKHVKQWWDMEEEWTIELIRQKYGTYIQGYKPSNNMNRPIKAYIICAQDKPIGYIQYYNVYDFARASSVPSTLPASCASFDMYIGEKKYLGKGIGSKALKMFIKEYIYQEFDSAFVDPDKKNLAAVRTYEKVGFEWFEKFADKPWMLIYKTCVRLTVRYRVIIESLFRKHFLKGDLLWIFGSRADMTRRGGDIDLYIETDINNVTDAMKRKRKFWVDLQHQLGEQKIDIVLNILSIESESPLPIYQIAKSEGIKIV